MKISATEKYRNIFGQMHSLATQESWTTGVSNMLEWLTWSTDNVLGVTKSIYTKQVVDWCLEKRGATPAAVLQHVKNKLAEATALSDVSERYAPTKYTIASAREALRRSKYFSEDYLNKEFDIYWTLVSDIYLDAFYGRFTRVRGGGGWYTHGNSGLFEYSTRIKEMQMDNLSYNPDERLLVANELKLGGKKNKDQILKYALMLKLLKERDFVLPDTRLLLLFISDKAEKLDKESLIAEEMTYCKLVAKSTTLAACAPDVVALARQSECESISWNSIISFNDTYLAKLDPKAQQVERKLLTGFNETLAGKKLLQKIPVGAAAS
jgi:hypothetical protein